MGDLEKNFLVFIGILLLCLVVSMMVYKKPSKSSKNAFGFKCVGSGAKKMCIKVNEVPNKENGVFSNYKDCVDNCESHPTPVPVPVPVPGILKSWKCFHDGVGIHTCTPTVNDVDPMNGFFATADECKLACGGISPNYQCTPNGCMVTYSLPVNNINVFATPEQCTLACHKGDFMDEMHYKCSETGLGCVGTYEMVGGDVYHSKEECVYKCPNKRH